MDPVTRHGRMVARLSARLSPTLRDPLVYPEIDPKTEIRIFELSETHVVSDRGLDSATLSGKFIVAKLADNPQYEALSYAWGDPVFSHKIEFPGGYLSITEHLYTALMKLRDEYRPRRL